jgi:hypothetical protein
MNEAQSLDVLLESAGDVIGVSPKVRPSQLVRDAPHHGSRFGQFLSRFRGGAERKSALVVVAGCLVQYSLQEKNGFLRGRRYISVHLDAT